MLPFARILIFRYYTNTLWDFSVVTLKGYHAQKPLTDFSNFLLFVSHEWKHTDAVEKCNWFSPYDFHALQKEPLPPRPCSADFLRAHSRSGPSVKGVRSCTPVNISPPEDKLTVPRAQSAADVSGSGCMVSVLTCTEVTSEIFNEFHT